MFEYASSLLIAKQDANSSIAEINEKQEAATHAHTAAKTAQSDADSATDADKSDKTTAATQAHDHAEAADAALRQAQQKWHDALDEKNRAADAATKLIVEVVSGDKKAQGADRRLDLFVDQLGHELVSTQDLEPNARRLVEKLALALQGSLLVRHGPPAVADASAQARRVAGEPAA